MSDELSRDHVQSVERCLAIITSFTGQKQRMTLSEVAAITGLSKPAVRRILLTLQELGFADSSNGRFGLTPKILSLGYAYLSSLNVPSLAQPLMEALTDQLDESTSLATLDGADVVYVSRVHRHRISSITLAVGTRLPAHATSMGHILLADLQNEALERYFQTANLVALTHRTITSREELAARLIVVRERGWDIVDQELEIGRRSVAAPVRDTNGAVIAALSFSCGAAERTLEEIIDHLLPPLLRTASQISGALGAGAYSSDDARTASPSRTRHAIERKKTK